MFFNKCQTNFSYNDLPGIHYNDDLGRGYCISISNGQGYMPRGSGFGFH